MSRHTKTIIIVGGSFAGIHTAWTLRRLLKEKHKIILLSDKAKTIFRASFPRVLFEGAPLEALTLDLAKNFNGTGITFIHDALKRLDQENDLLIAEKGSYKFDYLVLATGARHAYELIPGSAKYAQSLCDPDKILTTREAILNFKGGIVFAGVGAGYTPCDGPPMEVLLGLEHRLRKLKIRHKAKLHYITDKENLLPPGGPKIWNYLEKFFKTRGINVAFNVELVRLDEKNLYFKDGKVKRYDLCLLVPPYRGIIALKDSGLTNERGFVSVDWNTMRADNSLHRNIYAVGDCCGIPGPKQAHIALMQATIATEHIAWRINKKGTVRSYLPEFKCVMFQGGKRGVYLYSQWMSDGDVVKIKAGKEPYLSKIKFEELFFARRGDIGELHHRMMK